MSYFSDVKYDSVYRKDSNMHYVRLLGRSSSLSKRICCSVFVGLESMTCAFIRWLGNLNLRKSTRFFRRWTRAGRKVDLGRAFFPSAVGSRENCTGPLLRNFCGF